MFCGEQVDSTAKSEDDFTGKSPLLYAGSKGHSPDLLDPCSYPEAVSTPLFPSFDSSHNPPLSPDLVSQLSISLTIDIRSLSYAPSRTQFRSPQSSTPQHPQPTCTENQFEDAITTATVLPLPSTILPATGHLSLQISPKINTSSQSHGIFTPSWGKKPKHKGQVEKPQVAFFRAMSVNGGPFVEFEKKTSKIRLNTKDCFHIDAVNPSEQPSPENEMILQELDDTQTLSPLNKDRAEWDSKNITASSIQIKYTAITHHNGDNCPYNSFKSQTRILRHLSSPIKIGKTGIN
ncbi:hypothetical protein BLNAU_9378 [Blattamonas nauphoetae]|uniref:Uncharacterized protein n=1 Tax=Blattamonas nauphoetae TaxID=2049346 RepID=A0ABQ9XW29_9EUKA|nr:hypothetical protein BLNAU_9378 [Blattamonas nauphoetae]